jgi:hypothetical protein
VSRLTSPAKKAIATPAANARKDNSVITGIDGHGASPLPMDMDIAACGAACMPACAPAASPAGRTVIMPCLRWCATSHQFIG